MKADKNPKPTPASPIHTLSLIPARSNVQVECQKCQSFLNKRSFRMTLLQGNERIPPSKKKKIGVKFDWMRANAM